MIKELVENLKGNFIKLIFCLIFLIMCVYFFKYCVLSRRALRIPGNEVDCSRLSGSDTDSPMRSTPGRPSLKSSARGFSKLHGRMPVRPAVLKNQSKTPLNSARSPLKTPIRGSGKKILKNITVETPQESTCGSTSEEGNDPYSHFPLVDPRSLGGGSISASKQFKEKRGDRLSKEKQKFFRLSAFYKTKKRNGSRSSEGVADNLGSLSRSSSGGSDSRSSSSRRSCSSSSSDSSDAEINTSTVVVHSNNNRFMGGISKFVSEPNAHVFGEAACGSTGSLLASLNQSSTDSKAPWGFAAAAAAARLSSEPFPNAMKEFGKSKICDTFVNNVDSVMNTLPSKSKQVGEALVTSSKSLGSKGRKDSLSFCSSKFRRSYVNGSANYKGGSINSSDSETSVDERNWNGYLKASKKKAQSVRTSRAEFNEELKSLAPRKHLKNSDAAEKPSSSCDGKGDSRVSSTVSSKISSSRNFERMVGFGQLRSLYDGLSHFFTAPAHSRRASAQSSPQSNSPVKVAKKKSESVTTYKLSSASKRLTSIKSTWRKNSLMSKLSKLNKHKSRRELAKPVCYPTWRQITKAANNGGFIKGLLDGGSENSSVNEDPADISSDSKVRKKFNGTKEVSMLHSVSNTNLLLKKRKVELQEKVAQDLHDERRLKSVSKTGKSNFGVSHPWNHMSPSLLVKTAVDSKTHEQEQRRRVMKNDLSCISPTDEIKQKKKRLIAEATQTHHQNQHSSFLVPQPPTNTASACMVLPASQPGKKTTHLFPLAFHCKASEPILFLPACYIPNIWVDISICCLCLQVCYVFN